METFQNNQAKQRPMSLTLRNPPVAVSVSFEEPVDVSRVFGEEERPINRMYRSKSAEDAWRVGRQLESTASEGLFGKVVGTDLR
jgi:hypothetical protein